MDPVTAEVATEPGGEFYVSQRLSITESDSTERAPAWAEVEKTFLYAILPMGESQFSPGASASQFNEIIRGYPAAAILHHPRRRTLRPARWSLHHGRELMFRTIAAKRHPHPPRFAGRDLERQLELEVVDGDTFGRHKFFGRLQNHL